jgi:hypothetical protein
MFLIYDMFMIDKVRLRWVVDINESLVSETVEKYESCKGTTNVDEALADSTVGTTPYIFYFNINLIFCRCGHHSINNKHPL